MNAMTSLRRMALEAKAIRLDPNIMGYWKPCNGNVAGNSENYHAEIVAFIIDRIVGFYRTPAVAPYTFEGFDLDRLANLAQDKGPLGAAQLYENPTLHDSEAIFKIDTVTSYCGRPANVPGRPARDSFGSKKTSSPSPSSNGAEGAMVGWSNFKINLIGKQNNLKSKMMIEFAKIEKNDTKAVRDAIKTLNVTYSRNTAEEVKRSLEIITVHMFAILVGNLGKFGHNVFVLQRQAKAKDFGVEYGPFFYVDNDRSKWDSDVISRGKVEDDNLITTICKFPRSIALRLLLLDSSVSASTLGDLVLEATSHYNRFITTSPLFRPENAKVLNRNAAFLTSTIRSCVQQYGVDEVLIPEPWSVSYTDSFSSDPIFSRLFSRLSPPSR